MANTFKFGNKNWAWKEGSVLAYNDENNNFKPLPFDFTRSSSATRVNKDGLIEVVGSDEPRVDYLNNADGHLLLEPSRTNEYPYSNFYGTGGLQDFNAGTSTSTVTNNYAISPDGTQNAIRFEATVGSTSSDRAGLRDLLSVSAVDSTISFYGKSNTGSNQVIGIHFTGGTQTTVTLTNEWQRFEYTGLSNTGNYCGMEIRGTYTDLSVDVLLYGFQFEQGSYATSYIPTSGSSVTRAAEQGIDGGAGVPIFSNTTAVWFLDLERVGVDDDSSGSAIALRDSSFVQQIRLHFDSPSEQIRFRDGKASYATISTITGMGAGVRKKIALRIDAATLSTFSNGSKLGDYTRPTAFDIAEIDFATLGFKLYDMKFYNTALTDSELIALTS